MIRKNFIKKQAIQNCPKEIRLTLLMFENDYSFHIEVKLSCVKLAYLVSCFFCNVHFQTKYGGHTILRRLFLPRMEPKAYSISIVFKERA